MANWYVDSAATGANNGTTKADAFTTLAAANTASAAGDKIFIKSTSAETQASAMTLTSKGSTASPVEVYSVDFAGSTPPVSADILPGATITTTGAFGITIAGTGVTRYDGIEFSAGTGATSAQLLISATNTVFENCKLKKLGTTGNAAAIAATGSRCVLNNTTMEFGATGDGLRTNTQMEWRNTPNAIVGSFIPTTLVTTGFTSGTFYAEGVDFSAAGSGKTLIGTLQTYMWATFKDCKTASGVTISSTPASVNNVVLASRTDSAGTNYTNYKNHYFGLQIDETIIVRTGGWNDGATALSRKITTTSNARWVTPFEATPIAIWQDSTSAATATMEFIINAASLPLNDEIWFDLEYLGDASSPRGSFVTGSKADGLATGAALTASTEAWDSLATARADSTVYALGAVHKVASNSGRLFFCTTAGTSAGSEPGGYASAVDGGSVTDGSAVFRAGMRCKQTLSFTAAQKGYIYAYVKAGKASTTWYNDPKLVLA